MREDDEDAQRHRSLAILLPHFCHDLNNALSAVQGLAELLLRRTFEDDAIRKLDTIYEQAASAADRVSRISEFATTARGHVEPTDLRAVVAGAVAVVGPLFRSTRGELDLRIEGESFVCRTDGRGLMQALVVLAVASHASNPEVPRRVRITLGRRGEDVVLRASHPRLDEGGEEETTRTIRDRIVATGGRLRRRSLGAWTTRRIAVPAERPIP